MQVKSLNPNISNITRFHCITVNQLIIFSITSIIVGELGKTGELLPAQGGQYSLVVPGGAFDMRFFHDLCHVWIIHVKIFWKAIIIHLGVGVQQLLT